MSAKLSTFVDLARRIVQDPADRKANLLLEEVDYEECVDRAARLFGSDRPNRRIVHYTVTSSAFRFVLQGTGAILPTSQTSLDRWIEGGSAVAAVYHPYLTTAQNQEPLDPNTWREVREPNLVILELLTIAPASGVLRIEFLRPHVVHRTDATLTSILEADIQAFATLLGAEICFAAARRYVQNTGTSTFQNETVDRRTQSDIMAARAKDLMRGYGDMVGRGSGESGVAAAGVVRRFDLTPLHGRGLLWPRLG